jgi:hypothetical protein
VFGGRERSLAAAQLFRDTLLLRIEPDTRVRRRTPKGRRRKTDAVGVMLESYQVEGRRYERYVAAWRDADKRVRKRTFSVLLYGRREARARATEARAKGVAQNRAERLRRQRQEARERLERLGPAPAPVKDPRSRKGIRHRKRRGRGGR